MGKYQKRALAALEKGLITQERIIGGVLRDALVTMRGEMSKLYDKYAIDGKLTKAEMTKYNRYVAMEQQMIDAINPAITKTVKRIKKLTPEQYQEAFFRLGWAIDEEAGINIKYGSIDLEAVQKALENEYTKIAIEAYPVNTRIAVRRALVDGLSLGKSYPQMVKDLKKATNATYYQALRILRTEGQRAQNAGMSDVYQKASDQGIQGRRIWDATLDGDTRSTHGHLDGTPEDEAGLFYPGGYAAQYPLDENLPAEESINCRCRLRYEIEGYSPQVRRTREQGLIPYQTYEEWVKNYGPPVKRR